MKKLTSKFGLGVCSALLAFAGAAVAHAGQFSTTRTQSHAHVESAMSMIPPAEGTVCHKDHSGLDLSPPETSAAAAARLDAAVKAGGALIVVDVPDLDCAYCAEAIEKAFEKRSEVAEAFANARDGTVTIVVKAGKKLDDRTIRKVIKRRGFDAVSIRRDAALPDASAGETESD